MAKLPAQMATQAQESVDSGASGATFEAWPPGVYTGRLAKLTVSAVKGDTPNKGAPKWELEFDTCYDLEGHRKPGRQFTSLTIIESVMWKVGQFFAAFGVPTDTDTDNLINHRCRINVGTTVQQAGARTGQTVNEINGFQMLAESDIGYVDIQKLIRQFGGGQAPAASQPAAATASAPPATTQAQPAAVPAAAPVAEGVEF